MFSTQEEKNKNKSVSNCNHKLTKKLDPLLNLNHTKHKLAKPPKQAYLYFPTENEICEIKKINSQKFIINRRIFEGNIKYSGLELEKLDEFIKFSIDKAKKSQDSDKINDILVSIKNFNNANECNNLKIHQDLNQIGFFKSDLLRFLISFEFDKEKTLQSLIDYHNFKANTYPIEFNEKIKKILLSGFIYIHGRDNRFLPNIILNPNIFLIESKNNKDLTYNDWMLSVIYLLDYCINFMLIPGQIETWNIICDMKDIALYSVPNDLKNLLTIIQQNYKNRLNTMFVVNLGTFVGLIWNVIKGLMGENIQKKMKMINSKNNYAELYENINRNQLEVKYGGLAENIKMTYEDYSKNANNSQDINYNSNSSTNQNSFKVNENLNSELNHNLGLFTNIEDDFFSRNNFYFPPNTPSDEYFTEKDIENIDHFLIGEDEYKIKIMNDKSIVRSPFYKYDSNKDLRDYCIGNSNIINLEASSEEDKMVLELKHSHLILNNEEEFFSAIDYINADSSSIMNSSIYSEIIKLRKVKENLNDPKLNFSDSCNIDDINSNNSEMISFKKKPKVDLNDETNKRRNLIDFSANNNLNNTANVEKSTKNNKVTFLKKNKEGNDSKNSINNRNTKKQEIIIDDKEEAKKCKVSCGQVKMECSIF